MNKLKKWLYKQMSILSLALANVEKNSLSQKGETLSSDVNQTQRHTQGQLADSLKQGVVTQEVMNLRWRMYKIIKESESVTAEITGYDEDNMPIVSVKKRDNKRGLKKIRLDQYDSYPLEMVVDNSEITLSGNDAINNDNIKMEDVIFNYDDEGNIISATHGSISSVDFFATNKSEKPINITRTSAPNFLIENFTKKLNVRSINEKEKLLEFYVSAYPDEYNRTSRLLISEIKKIINFSLNSAMLEIDKVDFISHKTIGSEDFLNYEYEITSFDKIIEFNGYYVIKFKANLIINGFDILEQYKQIELDLKYANKEMKKR